MHRLTNQSQAVHHLASSRIVSHRLSPSLITSHYLSSPLITSHYLSLPLMTSPHLSRAIPSRLRCRYNHQWDQREAVDLSRSYDEFDRRGIGESLTRTHFPPRHAKESDPTFPIHKICFVSLPECRTPTFATCQKLNSHHPHSL